MSESKLVYTITVDREGASLFLNSSLCKSQTFKGMESEGVTLDHVIGRWVRQEVLHFGGILKG